MIRNGHYLVETPHGMNTSAWCLRCFTDFSTLRGGPSDEALEKACRGNWTKTLRNIEWQMSQLLMKMAKVRKWMAHEQKGRRERRSTPGGSPAPLSQQNTANRHR